MAAYHRRACLALIRAPADHFGILHGYCQSRQARKLHSVDGCIADAELVLGLSAHNVRGVAAHWPSSEWGGRGLDFELLVTCILPARAVCARLCVKSGGRASVHIAKYVCVLPGPAPLFGQPLPRIAPCGAEFLLGSLSGVPSSQPTLRGSNSDCMDLFEEVFGGTCHPRQRRHFSSVPCGIIMPARAARMDFVGHLATAGSEMGDRPSRL